MFEDEAKNENRARKIKQFSSQPLRLNRGNGSGVPIMVQKKEGSRTSRSVAVPVQASLQTPAIPEHVNPSGGKSEMQVLNSEKVLPELDEIDKLMIKLAAKESDVNKKIHKINFFERINKFNQMKDLNGNGNKNIVVNRNNTYMHSNRRFDNVYRYSEPHTYNKPEFSFNVNQGRNDRLANSVEANSNFDTFATNNKYPFKAESMNSRNSMNSIHAKHNTHKKVFQTSRLRAGGVGTAFDKDLLDSDSLQETLKVKRFNTVSLREKRVKAERNPNHPQISQPKSPIKSLSSQSPNIPPTPLDDLNYATNSPPRLHHVNKTNISAISERASHKNRYYEGKLTESAIEKFETLSLLIEGKKSQFQNHTNRTYQYKP